MINNETERLSAVNRFKKLDAGIKRDLNELINLVAQICNVPVALMSIIDDRMQWFKASVGAGDINCNNREDSFCNETILNDEMLIVPDATKDLRFTHLPIVTGPPHIKFYAGLPLITFDNQAVGTLCILHVETIELSPLQINSLKVLAKQVLNLIELNWSMQSLMAQNLTTQHQKDLIEDSEHKLKAVFDSSSDLQLLIGRQMEVLAFNKTAYQYVKEGYHKELVIGSQFLSITNQAFAHMALNHINSALNGETISVEWLVKTENFTARRLNISFEPVSDANLEIIGVAIKATNVI